MDDRKESQYLLTEEQLKAWTQFNQTKALLDFLKNNGVAYFRGKGGSVITTVDALNNALSNDKDSNKNFDW